MARTASITAAAEPNFVRSRRVAIMDLLPSKDPVRYGGWHAADRVHGGRCAPQCLPGPIADITRSRELFRPRRQHAASEPALGLRITRSSDVACEHDSKTQVTPE